MEGVDRSNEWKEWMVLMKGRSVRNEWIEVMNKWTEVIIGRSVWREWMEIMNGRSVRKEWIWDLVSREVAAMSRIINSH